ncbi:MAG: glycosyltransferase family 39 protein [Anaerolineales bacterium]|nr:glycosyltransferase family 39 protein [Anaerolineales bacterium]
MTTAVPPEQSSFLKKNLFFDITPTTLFLILIMVLALALHMYNIESIGDANAYYTAAVESMLKSWSNFFFAAAEPGGSVTVDKPPLGLWVEAIFAYFLGVSGFSVSLPNILSGVFGIPLLYVMVKKYMGELAGIVAALVMAVTPVFVATNRNNTMDGLLVFTLLLAAWVFIKATDTGKLGWLLLGAFILGLGFNIKMMQAFLPLPAFYALYFLGSKEGWAHKAINLGLATILLIAISLSWAVIVDLTPVDQRPYIGSSDDNTVMGLMFGHNGIARLENTGGPQNDQTPPSAPQPFDQTQDEPDSHPNQATQPQAGSRRGGYTQFSQETGEPGVLRFFITPLSKQMSWLLPFALISIVLGILSSRIQLPIESGGHKALILWGGWLLTCIVFFSMVSGIFHAYYAIMLAPALGAVVGIGFSQLWEWSQNKNWIGILLIAASVITIGFQVFTSYEYNERSWWMLIAGLLLIVGIILMVVRKRVAYVTLLAAMLVIPTYWTVMTVVVNPNINLPTAYIGGDQESGPDDGANHQGGPGQNVNEEMLAYLEENTKDVEYLVAVPSSQQGSWLVLATGRPVLYMGGFTGQDNVVSVDDLSAMVANGELRYVLYGDERPSKQDIINWLNSACSVMLDFSQAGMANSQTINGGNPGHQAMTLYLCK